jgi:predicted TIM-barrel fold metal-dependent hydrolase
MRGSNHGDIRIPEPSPVARKYADLTVIDVHNHDAGGSRYKHSMKLWDAYGIDQVVLFSGRITDPEAVKQDRIAWSASQEYPERILPFFTGFDVKSKDALVYVQNQFEKGFLGIGEYVGASYARESYAYGVKWKPDHPMDGYFSDVYALCAQYKAPILLHIDPPFPDFIAVQKFEEAIAKHPETTFIYAHANAFNTPENLERLLRKYSNLYIDFFAGFNIYNPHAKLPIDAYVPLIEQYPSRFLVSSDSGCDMEYYQAYEAIYTLLDKVSPETRERLAHENFEYLLEQRQSAMEGDLF